MVFDKIDPVAKQFWSNILAGGLIGAFIATNVSQCKQQISSYLPADLNNDGQRQELVQIYGNRKIAYFPNTNRNYQMEVGFDWNTVNSNELERIAMEAQE